MPYLLYFIGFPTIFYALLGYTPEEIYKKGLLEDITSLQKKDFMWGRFTAKHEDQFYCRAFFQNSTKKEYRDILSPRELEIFHCMFL